MTTTITTVSHTQKTPYTYPNATIELTFQVSGEQPKFIQVYGEEAGSQSANPIDMVLLDTITWGPSAKSPYTAAIKWQAGSAFTVFYFPRNDPNNPNETYDGNPWPDAVQNGPSITTKVPPGSPSTSQTKPETWCTENKPATLHGPGSITINWDSSPTNYDKFIVRWSWAAATDGSDITQVDLGGGMTGQWVTNQAVTPGGVYTFVVEGGTNQGLFTPDAYSGWGDTLTVTAAQNLRSLVDFLRNSGVDPANLSVKSIMGSQTSLRAVMQLN
jgi:hypothetical protein